MMNPFDPRTILMARHAQHVVLIHFPIALFASGVALDLLSRGKRVSNLATAAYINLTIAALTVVPAAATGLLAWQFVLDGRRLKGLLLLHFAGGLASTVLILASWWVQRRSRRSQPRTLTRISARHRVTWGCSPWTHGPPGQFPQRSERLTRP
jgi:uncharacterized membrane protein